MTPDQRLARALAAAAGRRLVRLRAERAGEPVAALRDAGDRRGHEFLVAALAAARPRDVVLSEEGEDDRRRLDAARLWIVDPLDGTREYGLPPRRDWAVHIALWEAGALRAAAVALPARRAVYAAGARLPARSTPRRPWRLAVSRTRAPEFLPAVAAAVHARLVPMGSAGAKAMAVLTGHADAYVHAGSMRDWDAAAPAGVAAAAGLHVSRLDGSPVRFNTAAAVVDQLLVCPPALAPALLRALAPFAG